MTLLTSGYWHSTFWAENYWMQDYWLEYGAGAPPVPPVVTEGDTWLRKGTAILKRKRSPRQLQAIKQFFEAELSE
jgi:hypothetical protein